jgi:hypothetical protein
MQAEYRPHHRHNGFHLPEEGKFAATEEDAPVFLGHDRGRSREKTV